MSDDLVKRLRELRRNQYANSNTAPEFVFLDPDLPPSEWEKQYGMDVVYVRGDVMWLNLKEQADRIEELEAKLAKAVEALQWCSGSADFNDGGIAREGWLKLCGPLIAELKGEQDD
jgi:hypothetical protein